MAKDIPQLSESAKQFKKGVYRHFKGDEMLVVAIALHSETQDEMVVYQHITGERKDEPYHWVRPLSIFLEEIDRDGYKGPRFTFLRKH